MTTSVDVRSSRPQAAADPGVRAAAAFLDAIFPPPRAFAVRLWDGTVLDAPGDRLFTLVLQARGALRRMFSPPLDLAIGEAYLRGDFDVEGDIGDAVAAFARLAAARPPAGAAELLRRWARLPGDGRGEKGIGFAPADLPAAKRSRAWEMSAIQYHYDIGNDWYELFLGTELLYTCAFFTDESQSLDQAQEQKLDLVCRKLRLQPGERLLDIGCGWGALLRHAAKHYGVRGLGVTLSRAQHDLAMTRIAEWGLADRVEVRVQDYRDLREPAFDKVSGIGIFEHVGRAGLGEYFGQAYRLLKPGGLFLNHGIAARMPHAGATPPGPVAAAARRWMLGQTEFRRKYLWPNGDLVPLSEATAAAEQAGFEVCDVENLRPHYVLTLEHWRRNMEASRERALQLGNETMFRLWRLFLAFAQYQFRSGAQTLNQVLFLKPDGGRHPLPLTRDWLA